MQYYNNGQYLVHVVMATKRLLY